MLLGGRLWIPVPHRKGRIPVPASTITTVTGRSRALSSQHGYSLDGEPWYRRMLGPTSLSWQAIIFAGILNFPQMVLTGGNLGARTVQPDEYPTIAAISALTILASFVYGYLGHLTVFRNRHVQPVPLATFLIFYSIGGLLYSIGIQISDAVSGTPSDIPFALRAVDAMLISIAWGIGVSLILDGRSRFRRERDVLLQELLDEQERTQQQGHLVREHVGDLTPDISESLHQQLRAIHDAAQRLEVSEDMPESIRGLAQVIDTAADVGARQSSHHAWEQALASMSKPRFGTTLRVALTSPRIWPAPLGVLIAAGVPTVAVRNFGIWWGLPATIALGLITWLWLRFIRGRKWGGWLTFITAFIGTVALVSAFAVLPAPSAAPVGGEIASIVIGVAGGFLLVSFVATLQRERSEILAALRTGVLREEAQRVAEARAVAHVARRLHGPVQTKLRICAAEIERAAELGDMAAVDAAVSAAMRALEEAAQEPVSLRISTTQALSELTETWKGFVDVSIDVDEEVGNTVDRNDIIEVVNEAIANAHHHGQASSAVVSVRQVADEIHISVSDNGSATDVGAAGLGTRLLRGTATSYDLSVSPDGALLRVTLPRAHERAQPEVRE